MPFDRFLSKFYVFFLNSADSSLSGKNTLKSRGISNSEEERRNSKGAQIKNPTAAKRRKPLRGEQKEVTN
ncbi:MAG: hypothetical protein KBS81_11680, partial [Spirochaetales bacterium]|nr:hypothetical protein [Candidatus Physcosoma equi]